MKVHQLVFVALGTPGVGAFLAPSIHGSSCGCSNMRIGDGHGRQRRQPTMRLEFSASPVNTKETLTRTTDLSLEGIGKKRKIALLGSTVRD